MLSPIMIKHKGYKLLTLQYKYLKSRPLCELDLEPVLRKLAMFCSVGVGGEQIIVFDSNSTVERNIEKQQSLVPLLANSYQSKQNMDGRMAATALVHLWPEEKAEPRIVQTY